MCPNAQASKLFFEVLIRSYLGLASWVLLCYTLIILAWLLSLHFLLSAAHTPYSNATSLSSLFKGFIIPLIPAVAGYPPPGGSTTKYTNTAVLLYNPITLINDTASSSTSTGGNWMTNSTQAKQPL
ncbi:hypothetical protein DFH08DRAFT_965629 [Mycena albidolilacea]|uniref:Uncharacterized protein n=1 Tax=Mycena albidolilacea TaxID=1033008 RepID=A0AAD6ZRS7_9AGAR|nr:hypothetical protein DFH08DRAFT_965629 [Mycena albidolilacea]